MSLFASLRAAAGPDVAVELASHRVSAATIDVRGGQRYVSAHATEGLPDGAIVPSLTASNIHDPDTVVAALERVFERIGRARRIGLVVPDPVAKVSLVRFEKVPSRAQDLEQLVQWQVKKAAPFPIDEAQVSFVPGLLTPEGQEFVVSLARRDIIEEYERVCAAAGAHAGIVDLATFNVVNAVLAASGPQAGDASTSSASPRATSRGDWLLVNVAPDYASIAIVRGRDLIFFRNRSAETDGTLADLVHQTAMYYEDRLSGRGFARVMLAGAAGPQAAEVEEARRSLQERLATHVEMVDPRASASLTDRIVASPALLDALTPLVGMLVRDAEAAA
jgi:Tfp pilus assembly PilM family ATPase